jgi:hypothetical protein
MTQIERNITSSDVDFLEGEDSGKKGKATTMMMKDKRENTRSFDNALTTPPDLSGLKHKASEDVDMGMSDDIMSVLDQL